MHPKAEQIRKFYTSFGNRDAREMAACCNPAVNFSDEVLTDLEGVRAVGMWHNDGASGGRHPVTAGVMAG